MTTAASATSLLPERRRGRPHVTVAQALGSATRADIYDHLQAVGGPCTVRDVAATFDLHPNVARTHLELLADAGLVTVGRRKRAGGGRPAKVYTACDEPAGAQPAVGERADPVGPLLVRLLVALAEERPVAAPASRTGTSALTVQAHELAVAEGRRLVAGLLRTQGTPAVEQDLESAARLALRGLAEAAPGARMVHAGADWVDVAGVAGMFTLLRTNRPALADAFERGLLSGALAAAGVPASVAEGGTGAAGEPLLRAKALPAPTGRPQTSPAETVDARGGHREAGVVRAMRAITGLRAGEVLEVLAEGPGAPAAFARWADRAGHELLGVERATDPTGRPAIRLLIRKGG